MPHPDPNTISNIIVLDTHPVIRRALTDLLRENFIGTQLIDAKNIAEFRKSDPTTVPAIFVVVINSDFEDEHISPLSELKTYYPNALVVLFGEEIDPELVISYFKSGVNGYLSKYGELTEMIACIKTVNLGKLYINGVDMEFLFLYLIQNYKTARKQDLLTPRQNEVARYLIQGMTTSSIAEKTGLHISTISTFKTGIFTKLGIDNILKLKQIMNTGDL
jgi:DNA-binding NarL/FixJ family response regulator